MTARIPEASDGGRNRYYAEVGVHSVAPDWVTFETFLPPPYEDDGQAWDFPRKKFLKGVAKALGVAIYDPQAGKWYGGKEKAE